MRSQFFGLKGGLLLFLTGTGFMLSGCAAPLAVSVPTLVAGVVGGTQLALKGGDLYKEMRKANARKAFEMPFEGAWEISIQAVKDLGMEPKAGKNKEGDAGVIEASAKGQKVRIGVLRLTENVAEIGVWVKKDPALASLIMEKIEATAPRQSRLGSEYPFSP